MGSLGFSELIIILLVALLIFGAKRIPEISRAIGKSVGEFKKGLRDSNNDNNINNG